MKIFVDNLRIARVGELEDWNPDELRFLENRVLVMRGGSELARMYVGDETDLDDEELIELGFEPERFDSSRGRINDWEVKNGYFVLYRPTPLILKLYTGEELRKAVFEELFPELMYWYDELSEYEVLWKKVAESVLVAKLDETVLILSEDGLWVEDEFAGPVEWGARQYSREYWVLDVFKLPTEVRL